MINNISRYIFTEKLGLRQLTCSKLSLCLFQCLHSPLPSALPSSLISHRTIKKKSEKRGRTFFFPLLSCFCLVIFLVSSRSKKSKNKNYEKEKNGRHIYPIKLIYSFWNQVLATFVWTACISLGK